MRPDRFERRYPVVGFGHHLDRATRGERPDDPVAEQRMVVTHNDTHLFAGHEAQRRHSTGGFFLRLGDTWCTRVAV